MRISCFLYLLPFFFLYPLYGQDDNANYLPEYYVDITVHGLEEIQKLSNDYSIDRVSPLADQTGYQVRLWIPGKSFAAFQSLAIPYTVVLEDVKSITVTDSCQRILATWDAYPTYNAYLEMLSYFATSYPDICAIDTILQNTPGGRVIPVIHINNGDGVPKPSVLLSSTIHGDEIAGYYLMLRLTNHILSTNDDPRIGQILENIDLWICPLENPDGTYYSSNNTLGFSPISTRGNANHVDLNRNYPYITGTAKADCEPETQAFIQFFNRQQFVLSTSTHGGAEVMNYPWDAYSSGQVTHPDAVWWEKIGCRFVETCRTVRPNFMTSVSPSGVTAGGDWYVVMGSRQDYVTYFEHAREYTIEISDTKALPSALLNNWWNITKDAFLDFILEADKGIKGKVTDATSQETLDATIFIEKHDIEWQKSFVLTNNDGHYFRPIAPGTYDVVCLANQYEPQTKRITVVADEIVLLDFELTPIESSLRYSIYPTLTQYEIMVKAMELDGVPATCHIYAMNGSLVQVHALTNTQTAIPIESLAPGTYILHIRKDDRSEKIKFVKH